MPGLRFGIEHEPPTDESRNDFTFSEYGDRAKRMYGPDFPGHPVLEATILFKQQATTIYSDNALMQIQVAQTLGDAGKDLLESTRVDFNLWQRRRAVDLKRLIALLELKLDPLGGGVEQDGHLHGL